MNTISDDGTQMTTCVVRTQSACHCPSSPCKFRPSTITIESYLYIVQNIRCAFSTQPLTHRLGEESQQGQVCAVSLSALNSRLVSRYFQQYIKGTLNHMFVIEKLNEEHQGNEAHFSKCRNIHRYRYLNVMQNTPWVYLLRAVGVSIWAHQVLVMLDDVLWVLHLCPMLSQGADYHIVWFCFDIRVDFEAENIV